MKRRNATIAITLGVLTLLVAAGGAYLYSARAWVLFAKPRDGGPQLGLEATLVAGSGESGFADGRAAAARLAKPIRLAPFAADSVVFADIDNHAVRVAARDGLVRTLAGGPDKEGHEDGPAERARFASPHGVALRSDGAIAVAEAGNHTVRLMTPEGESFVVSTLAGTPGTKGMRDGPAVEARFDAPHAVVWGPAGELFVADIGNGRIRLVRDGRVETVAGGDGAMKWPMDIARAGDGMLWILDAGTLEIRCMDSAGGLTNPLPSAKPAMPHGIALDGERAVLVAELYGHRVLAFDRTTGEVSTVLGSTEPGADLASLHRPAAVLVHAGLVWVADLGNHRIVTVPLPDEYRPSPSGG